MLRYARKLDPNQSDVLLMLGKVAEESGRPDAAIEALDAYNATLTTDETPNADAPLHLGRAYMRLGRWDDAVRQFRMAMQLGSPGYGPAAAAGAYLGVALMNTGRIADAIEALLPAAQNQNWYQAETMQEGLTLAVAYDRDEQLSSEFTLLDSIQQQLTGSYPQYVQQGLLPMEFVPSYDQHYYYALFYESQGYLAEARTEWMHYAEVPDAPYRGRALDHVKAIDALEAQKLKDAKKAADDAAKAAKKKGKGKAGAPVPPPPPPPVYSPYAPTP
jgi:tetratricopeptide (TPR) repeat protein